MYTDNTETLNNALAEIARLQAEVKRQQYVIRLWRDVSPHHDIESHLEALDPDYREQWGAEWAALKQKHAAAVEREREREQLRIERERQEAERAKLAEAQAAIDAERAALEAQQAAIKAEQEQQRRAAELAAAEQAAAEKALRDAEEKAKAEALAEQQRIARAQARKPQARRVAEWMDDIEKTARALPAGVTDETLQQVAEYALTQILAALRQAREDMK